MGAGKCYDNGQMREDTKRSSGLCDPQRAQESPLYLHCGFGFMLVDCWAEHGLPLELVHGSAAALRY